jgi:hypothetical protein
MLRNIHETNFFHIKFLGRNNIKCQNGPVLPPAQVFYFNGQALCLYIKHLSKMCSEYSFLLSRHKVELDGRAVSALGVRSRKLSTGVNGQS